MARQNLNRPSNVQPLRVTSLCFLIGLAIGLPITARSDPAPPSPVQADLRALQIRLLERVRAHEGPAAVEPDMAEYDILMAKYRDQPDALAAIAANRAGFTLLILKNEQKAKVLLEAVLRDFPDTKSAAMAKVALHSLSQEGKAEQVAKAAQARAKFDQLIGCEAPELDFIWSSQEGLGKLSSLRGRVVVLDFWATWCGPCIASFPKVRKEVERFASSPVVILGVTSLQGKVHGLGTKPIDVKEQPEKEYAFTAEFMKKHDMTWPVAFTAQDVFNPDYLVRGIPSIVIIDPAGKIRHAGLNPHTRGVDIEGKVTGILKEFNMPVPASL